MVTTLRAHDHPRQVSTSPVIVIEVVNTMGVVDDALKRWHDVHDPITAIQSPAGNRPDKSGRVRRI